MKKNNWRLIILIAIIAFGLGFYLGVKKGASDAAQILFDSGYIEKTDK